MLFNARLDEDVELDSEEIEDELDMDIDETDGENDDSVLESMKIASGIKPKKKKTTDSDMEDIF